MALSQLQKKHLRRLGHNLNALVTIAGKGLSDNILTEINRALGDHELIKIKLVVGDRLAKRNLIDQLCQQAPANLIQSIGNIALIYRANPCADPKKSNLRH